MEGQRFNAVRNGDGFNCPRCYRSRSLIEINRRAALWECREDARGPGCMAVFRFEANPGNEYDTLVQVELPAPPRQTPMDYAAKMERFL